MMIDMLNTDSESTMKTCEATGDQAVGRGEYEYALDLYEDALALHPNDLTLRKKLRIAQIKAHRVRKEKATPLLSVWKLAICASRKKDPFEALEFTERIMRRDPFNPKSVLRLIITADKTAIPEIATQALEILLEADPTSEFLLSTMAERKRTMGDARAEYECLAKLIKLRGNDSSLLRKVKDAAARVALMEST